jgi:hypothetical protein
MHPRSGKVLSIVGSGRSGSTILSSVLSETPGVFGAGELRWLWSRDLPQQRVCGCGRPPAECPVWSAVVERTLSLPPSRQEPDALVPALRELVLAQERVGGTSHRLRLLTSPGSQRAPAPDQRVVTEATVATMSALFEQTGARVVVDASKRPQEAAILAASGAFDHFVVHIVRDPRAVVYSWRRSKPLPAAAGKAAMGTRSQRRTVYRWVENAVGAELLRRRVPAERWLFVRYEDFAASPRETVRRILELVGEPAETPFLDEDTIRLGENHTLSGNPSRFQTGPVRIVPDSEWSQRMSGKDQALIQGATFPFLVRYGYPLGLVGASSA